mgnify:CR=1 FL=1
MEEQEDEFEITSGTITHLFGYFYFYINIDEFRDCRIYYTVFYYCFNNTREQDSGINIYGFDDDEELIIL